MLRFKISAIVFAVLVLEQELLLLLEGEGLLSTLLLLLTHELSWIELNIRTSHVVHLYIACNIVVIVI